ncbi:hypothetical protein Syun_009955 [Stephania yunnanensis]|uniref:Uncharacterized protein n=1 Tax=Stephania yunnanensis TaxID=152371 RepID=A0AAP0PSS8_9MAGN
MQLSSSVALSWALKAVVDLEVFEVFAKAGPGTYLSASEIIVSHHSPKNADRAAQILDRILCLLVSHSVLSCLPVMLKNGRVERRYGMTSTAKYLAKREDGLSMSWFLPLVLQKEYYTAWANLKHMVLEGGEVNEHSIAMDECEMDPNIGKIYNKSQYSLTTVVMEKMMEVYKGFEGLKSLIDVGGGVGTASSFISRKYPSIKVINFDLPRVIEEAPVIPVVNRISKPDKSTVRCGADQLPPKTARTNLDVAESEQRNCRTVDIRADEVDDGHIAKSTDSTAYREQSRRNVARCNDGTDIINCDHHGVYHSTKYEPKHSMRNFYQLDVIVMALSWGGKERDEEDFNVLGKKAGFASVKTACRAYGYWIIELRKSP